MKEGWENRRLENLVESDSPITYGVVKPGDPGDVLFIRGGDVSNGRVLTQELRTITSDVSRQYSRTLLKGGELLMCLVGQPGQVGVAPMELAGANIARQVGLIRLQKKINTEFVSYYLQSPDGKANLGIYTGGSVQQVINLADLKKVQIPIPPLTEQKRIVAILDEAFAGISQAIANTERNLKNARELFDSYLEEIFSQKDEEWTETTIGKIATIKGGKRVPKGYKLTTESTGYPYLRVTDFNSEGTIDTNDLHYVSKEIHNTIKNYIIKSADIYISIAGTIGKTGIVPPELDGAHLTENACRLVLKPLIHNKFLYYFTRTPQFIEQAGLNTRTAAQPKLALSRLSNIRLAIPGLPKQKQIVEKLNEIYSQIGSLDNIYQQKLTALAELKQSILQKAFTGQLTDNLPL